MKTKSDKLIKVTTAAMLAAFTCVTTVIIRIPMAGTSGYINLGDSIVLLTAFILGGPFGALSAGLGALLADLLAGYAAYIPGTFAIKFLMALTAGALQKLLLNRKVNKVAAMILSAIVGECIMVVGYFAYEGLVLSYGSAAAFSIPGNVFQGVTCIITGVILTLALSKRFKFTK